MKETHSRFLFSIRYAYKNIVRHPLRSVLLILSLLALMTSLMLATTSKDFMTEYFLGDLNAQYGDLDLVASVGTAGNARYFTLRTLQDDPNQDIYFKDVMPFFEMNTLVEFHGDYLYVNVMSSSIETLKKVSSIRPDASELSGDEAIVTRSLSSRYSLVQGDSISMRLGSVSKSYVIRDIVEDAGLMTGDAVYVNKTHALPFFLSALNPTLSGLPNIFFTNLYNTLYLDIQDGQSLDSVRVYLLQLPGYENLFVRSTFDRSEIDAMVERNMAVFSVIFVIVILAILLVMSTTLMVYFEEKKKMVALVSLMGGTSLFSFGIIVIEFSFLFILSSFLSVLLTQSIITNGMRFIGSGSSFILPPIMIFLTLGVALLIFLCTLVYHDTRAKKSISIREMRETMDKDPRSWKFYAVLSILMAAIAGLTYLFDVDRIGLVLRGVSALILLFSIPFALVLWMIHKPSDTEIGLRLRMLVVQKSFRHYASVLLLSFLSIFLLVLANTHMEHRFESHRAEYKVHFALINFITRYDETLVEVRALESVSHADPSVLFENIYFPDFGDSILMTVSMDPEVLSDYFSIEMRDVSITYLSEAYPVILLPERYEKLYGLSVGDTIIGDVHPSFPNVEFVIGGFFEKYIANLAFTNLHQIQAFNGTGIASIFINEKEGSTTLFETLVDAYAKHLVYVMDYQAFVESNVNRMEKATLYMTVILMAILLCFVLSVFNHALLLLEHMKKNDSRVYILGMSKRRMISLLLKESIILLSCFLVGSMCAFYLLSTDLTGWILWSGEYENIRLSGLTLSLGVMFVVLVYGWTRLVYIVKILNIRPSNVLRLPE